MKIFNSHCFVLSLNCANFAYIMTKVSKKRYLQCFGLVVIALAIVRVSFPQVTGKNVGKGTPTVFWDIVPDSDQCEIYAYMAGGGCTLPGKAMVLMPGAGYEGVTRFVMDVMTSYGLNACPPLLVGVGVATSVETAALLSKKALMRPLGSHNENERAAYMEQLLEDGINAIGLGPQGMGGKYSVMGVHIENTARHPSAIGVAVNVGCWSHRRGHIIFDKDLNYTITTHSGVTL